MPTINDPTKAPQPPIKKHLSLPLDLRLLVLVLLVIIAAMLFVWKPWQAQIKASDRTITVTGSATLSAIPDEYVFNPSYDFTNVDKQTALNQLSVESSQVIAQLKSLGVADSAIQTNSNGYSGGIYLPVEQGNDNTYTLSLTITVEDKALAQKVQDYLATTTPSGGVSPQADFSNAKQKSLESQARDEATKDARDKADQSAKDLGFTVAAVKSATDGSGFGSPVPLLESGGASSAGQAVSPSLGVQPGENKLTYSVTVIYYIH
jgi:uncharacterized protein YggE